jgi:hypothetical protein
VKLGLSHFGTSQLQDILTIRRRRKHADLRRGKREMEKVVHMEIHNRPRALQQKLLQLQHGKRNTQSKLAYISRAGLILLGQA